jgi:hypothetical protein
MDASKPAENRQEAPRSAVYVNSGENLVFNAEHIEVNIHLGDRAAAFAKASSSAPIVADAAASE